MNRSMSPWFQASRCMRMTDRISETALDGTCSFAPGAAEIGEPAMEAKSISTERKMARTVELRLAHTPRVLAMASPPWRPFPDARPHRPARKSPKERCGLTAQPTRETHMLPGIHRCARSDLITLICKRDNSSYLVVRRVKVRTWEWLFQLKEMF